MFAVNESFRAIFRMTARTPTDVRAAAPERGKHPRLTPTQTCALWTRGMSASDTDIGKTNTTAVSRVSQVHLKTAPTLRYGFIYFFPETHVLTTCFPLQTLQDPACKNPLTAMSSGGDPLVADFPNDNHCQYCVPCCMEKRWFHPDRSETPYCDRVFIDQPDLECI